MKHGRQKAPHRKSPEEKGLIRGVEALIALYHSKEFSKPSSEWSWEPILGLVGRFLEALFEEKWEYEKIGNGFDFYYGLHPLGGGKEWKKRQKPAYRRFYIDERQLKIFLTLFAKLTEEIKCGQKEHLYLETVIDLFKTSIDLSKESETDKEYYWTTIPGSQEEICKLGKNGHKRSLGLVKDAVKDMIGTGWHFKRYKRDEMIASCSKARMFQIRLISEFSQKDLLLKVQKEDSDDYLTAKIPDIFSSEILSFLPLAITTLIQYHIAFNDLSRLKICKYSECGKLLLEKTRREKKYCCSSCKVRANRNPERKKCFERQNAFGRKHKLYRVKGGREEKWFNIGMNNGCSKCRVYRIGKKGGTCERYLTLNKEKLKRCYIVIRGKQYRFNSKLNRFDPSL